MSTRTTPGGHKIADMAICHKLHNFVAARIAEIDGRDDEAVCRRLRVLSAMLLETAAGAFERDFEAEGEQIAADFWARAGIICPGEDDASGD
jgi:hypothetical protein